MLSPYWAKSSTPMALLWRYLAEKKLNKQANGVDLSVLSTNSRTCYKHTRIAVCPLPIVAQRDSYISHGAIRLVPLTAGQAPVAAANSSPGVSGQKYSDAASTLGNAGFESVVSTTVEDRKAWTDCLATFNQQRDVQRPPSSKGTVNHRFWC